LPQKESFHVAACDFAFEDSRRRCRIHALCVVAVAPMALVCSRAAGAAEIFVTSQTSGTPAGCSLVEAI
jgi:hypothetical protein